MSLLEKIQNDLKDAFKKSDKDLVSVLRLLVSAIHNKEIEKRTKLVKSQPEAGRPWADEPTEKLEELSKLNEEELIEVISSEAKKRKEAILEFSAHGGSASGGEKEKIDNIIKKEKAELEILEKYLPEQLPEEEVKKLVKEAIEKTGAKEMKEMGKVMAELMPKIKGKADGGAVGKIVREFLTKEV